MCSAKVNVVRKAIQLTFILTPLTQSPVVKTKTITISDVTNSLRGEIATKDIPIVHTETKTITYESAQVRGSLGHAAFVLCNLSLPFVRCEHCWASLKTHSCFCCEFWLVFGRLFVVCFCTSSCLKMAMNRTNVGRIAHCIGINTCISIYCYLQFISCY